MIRAFRKSDEGANTISMAIVFPFVLVMFFSFIETGFLMLRWVLLERGVDIASRELRVNGLENADMEAYLDEAMNIQSDYVAELETQSDNGSDAFSYEPYTRESDEATNVATHLYVRDWICKNSNYISSCEEDIRISLTSVDSNTGIPDLTVPCADRTGKVNPVLDLPSVDPGIRNQADARDIMYMRVCLVVDPIVPVAMLPFLYDPDIGLLITADSAYINEPE